MTVRQQWRDQEKMDTHTVDALEHENAQLRIENEALRIELADAKALQALTETYCLPQLNLAEVPDAVEG